MTAPTTAEGEVFLPFDLVVDLAIQSHSIKSFLRTLHTTIQDSLPPDTDELSHGNVRVQLSMLRDLLEEL